VFAPAAPPPGLGPDPLPVVLLPTESFVKLAEFWGTMGLNHRWRPCVYVVITVPILAPTFPAGPAVTTLLADSRVRGVPATADVIAAFGGTVRSGGTTVGGAWVELLTIPEDRLQLARTDAEGRFTFHFVPPGSYKLRASSTTQGPSPVRTVLLPSPGGEYDLVL
jgi:hypothetical protein